MTYYQSHQQSGFSLIEALVAITILLIVVAGPLTILTTTARSTNYASEQVTAFFLAQEGLELVQKVRDDRFLEFFDSAATPDPWTRFKNDFTIPHNCFTGPCEVEIESNGSIAVTNGDGTLRRSTDLLTDRARFTHGMGGTEATTPVFRRTIRMVDEGDGVKVTSEVTWISGSVAATQRFAIDSYLYNTYGTP